MVRNGGAGRRPHRPTTVTVTVISLTALRLLVLVGLLLQLSILLLLIAGPVPLRLEAVSSNTLLPPLSGTAPTGPQPLGHPLRDKT